jgi:hypothetical protein
MVLAEASAWTYVAFSYGLTVALIGGYSAWIIQRGRKIGRQLPPEDRKWSQ